MNIYFSGIGGVGIGPLAEIARDAGHAVFGSDMVEGLVTDRLQARGMALTIGQDGTFLRATHEAAPLDWFVYTAALADNHPELTAARELGIRTGKRDEFLAAFIREHNLKLVAISGTHGKTTTTGMAVWALKALGVPVSYSIGTTLSFGQSGAYDPESKFFIYEADEYDRNFLHFSPKLSLLTSIDYDHPDTYPTEAEYREAFREYISQSEHTIAWQPNLSYIQQPPSNSIWALKPSETMPFALPGEHNRRNATLVYKALEFLAIGDTETRTAALESFPGTDRRFERLADHIYSDYGHHPEEIAATLQLAHELSNDIVLVYQPHQNWRQHFIKDQYVGQFTAANELYWLPTYLTRENPDQAILSPETLTENLTNKNMVQFAELNDALWERVEAARARGALVLFMGAGSIDGWVRSRLAGAN